MNSQSIYHQENILNINISHINANLVLAIILTSLHIKREDESPKYKPGNFIVLAINSLLMRTQKEVYDRHEENLVIFDLLSQLLALALHNDLFVFNIRDVADIYSADPTIGRVYPSEDQERVVGLDIPIFREPEHIRLLLNLSSRELGVAISNEYADLANLKKTHSREIWPVAVSILSVRYVAASL
jgi:hypothetical protein